MGAEKISEDMRNYLDRRKRKPIKYQKQQQQKKENDTRLHKTRRDKTTTKYRVKTM